MSSSPRPPAPAVRVRGLRKRFGTTTALDGVDLDVEAGTVVGLLGPNGAGKTTLVRILATLLRHDAGEVEVLGHQLPAESAAVRRGIALTGQYAAVDELLSGRENLRLFGRLLGLTRREAGRRADELLARFDLLDAADRPARTYSGGMRRRLDLASSLLVMPRLAFLDEPTTGLDPRSRSDIWDAVRELVDDGVTVLLTTQYLEEADALADRIAVIDAGRVVAEGTSDDLKDGLGGAVLQVRLRSPAQQEAARRALAPLGRATSTAGEPALLSVPVGGDGLDLVARGAAALRRDGVDVVELGLRRPTLDEVFLSLTSPTGTAPDDGETPAAALAVSA